MANGSPAGGAFFLPVRVLSRLFRRLFLTALEKAFRKDKLHFHGDQSHLGQEAAFDDFIGALKNCEWVVYAQPPFGGPLQVLRASSAATRIAWRFPINGW